jgi:hypothetical protein
MQSKNIQYQGSSVDDTDIFTQTKFKLTQMARGKLIIKDHHIRQIIFNEGFELIYLSGANKRYRVRYFEALGKLADYI